MGSRSARPPRTAINKRPVLVDVSANASASERNCPIDALNDGEKVEGRADEAEYSRHGHHVTGYLK